MNPKSLEKPTSESSHLEGSNGFREYIGSGKHKDYAVLTTGPCPCLCPLSPPSRPSDSFTSINGDIGSSVAVLMAHEGDDSTIAYLPQEQPGAEEDTGKLVEGPRRRPLAPFDPENFKDARGIIEKQMKRETFQHQNFSTRDNFIAIQNIHLLPTYPPSYFAMFAMMKFALPHMKNGFRIINTTSVASRAFTTALAKDLNPNGICANATAPGPVHTALKPASRPGKQTAGFGSKSKIGRPGQPSQVATSYSMYFWQVSGILILCIPIP
ncbi:hypothetical protein HOY80DRAFT_1012684 [Tuber brumale]|nr:hypothetical protein HOY80DRAFT_1012684 [Tuber brumale]